MKTRNRWVTGAVGALLAAAVSAQPYGMGPGMMGPGMMGGYGNYGMGPGMMGHGMGPGMMWGYANLDLTAEQRKQIADIQQNAFKSMWQLMGAMHEQDYHMNWMSWARPFDEAEARKAFQAMTEAHKAMFEAQLDARRRIDAVLTKEQRERLQRDWRGR